LCRTIGFVGSLAWGRLVVAVVAVVGETDVVESPETRYARSGDVSVAYQVVGEGPRDLVWIPSMAHHVPGEVLVSSTVKDLVAGSGIEFEDRGEHQLKGITEPWRLFTVVR